MIGASFNAPVSILDQPEACACVTERKRYVRDFEDVCSLVRGRHGRKRTDAKPVLAKTARESV